LHAHLRALARRRLERARDGAAQRQPPHPAGRRVRGERPAELGTDRKETMTRNVREGSRRPPRRAPTLNMRPAPFLAVLLVLTPVASACGGLPSSACQDGAPPPFAEACDVGWGAGATADAVISAANGYLAFARQDPLVALAEN